MKKTTILICALALLLALSACSFASGKRFDDRSGRRKQPSEQTTLQTNEAPQSDDEASEQRTSPSPAGQNEFISRDHAIDTALQKAGLDRQSVYDLDADLDRELFGTYWEVDFETREKEYSYHIDAVTGKILHKETERNGR